MGISKKKSATQVKVRRSTRNKRNDDFGYIRMYTKKKSSVPKRTLKKNPGTQLKVF